MTPLPAACGTTEDSRLWKGRLAVLPAELQYVVQAANGLGLVSLDDNRGSYYRLAGATPAVATTLALVSPPAAGTFGDSPTVTARLTQTAGGAPIAGKTVTIGIGGSAAIGTTGADGRVTLQVPLSTVPGSHQLVASFAGDTAYLPSSAAKPFAIAKAQTSLSIFLPNLIVTPGGTTGIDPTLTASIGGKKQPLLQQTVTFTVFRPGLTKTFSTITDYLGRATLPPTGLAAGLYVVTASFAGDATYTAATRPSVLLISQFTGFLSPVKNPPTLNTVNAGSVVPIRFSLGGFRGLQVFAAGSPRVLTINCTTKAPTGPVENADPPGNSGLDYSDNADRYEYGWKTKKSWAGGCRRLELRLVDGTVYSADFKLQ